MISISGKYWEEVKVQKRLIDKIKIDYDLSENQAKLAISRKFTDEDFFLINKELEFKNPFLKTNDFLFGCELLNENIKNKKNILIIGDYDVDGCMSTSLFINFLKKNNVKVNYYIPDRFNDGYGASEELIIKLTDKFKTNLIIFLDCGSNSYDAIKYLKSKKIKTFIIDHHNTKLPYPESDIFINPKKNTNYGQYDYLCTTFLTYLFIDLYIKKYKLDKNIQNYQIYVLLATIADVMPLRGINKILAKNVLKNFDINKNFLLNKLFEVMKINNKLTLYELGYKIAPLINAAGRLENANQIIELFTTRNVKRILSISENIYNLNIKRKSIEKLIVDDLDYKKFYDEKNILFIYKPNLHEGIIGIIASKIKDYFNKPCIILTNNGDKVKGSARSTSDFNIGEYIQKSIEQGILLGGGGHNLAAGIILKKNKINEFKKYINSQYVKKYYLSKNIYLSILSTSSINIEFVKSIEKLGPFGNKNPYPIFLIQDIKFIKPTIIKDKFIIFFIKKGNKIFKSISYNHLKSKISYQILNSQNSFDILVKVKKNNWNNKSNLELEIVDLIKNTNKP
jgi:single-stranded-DNA-specific exonuclease